MVAINFLNESTGSILYIIRHRIIWHIPHASSPYFSGKLKMWSGIPSGSAVSLCTLILFEFHTVSLKISNSFCIRGTMMKAKSDLPKH